MLFRSPFIGLSGDGIADLPRDRGVGIFLRISHDLRLICNFADGGEIAVQTTETQEDQRGLLTEGGSEVCPDTFTGCHARMGGRAALRRRWRTASRALLASREHRQRILNDWRIAIVGGGPGGLFTAWRLREQAQ